jgi:hypothetical protein
VTRIHKDGHIYAKTENRKISSLLFKDRYIYDAMKRKGKQNSEEWLPLMRESGEDGNVTYIKMRYHYTPARMA